MASSIGRSLLTLCSTLPTTAAILTVGTKPVVNGQPQDQTVCAGATATHRLGERLAHTDRAVASECQQRTLQQHLRRNQHHIEFHDLRLPNRHRYRAVFTNSFGDDTSSAALLTVNTAPNVTTNPASQSILADRT